jgi:hypothetical protein
MVHVDHLDKRNTKQIRRSIRAFGSHVLPAFRKVLGQSLRILPHQKPAFDLKFKAFGGFCRPDSLGNNSHGMPLQRTNIIPARTARSSSHGLPPLGWGFFGGIRCLIRSQNASETSSLAMVNPPKLLQLMHFSEDNTDNQHSQGCSNPKPVVLGALRINNKIN